MHIILPFFLYAHIRFTTYRFHCVLTFIHWVDHLLLTRTTFIYGVLGIAKGMLNPMGILGLLQITEQK